MKRDEIVVRETVVTWRDDCVADVCAFGADVCVDHDPDVREELAAQGAQGAQLQLTREMDEIHEQLTRERRR